MSERQARLAALRAEAVAAGEAGEQAAAGEVQQPAGADQQEADAPVLRFRNYAPAADERIAHQKASAAAPPPPRRRHSWLICEHCTPLPAPRHGCKA